MLRKLNDKIRIYRLDFEEKSRILERLKEILEKEDNIICAIVFGGFLKDRPFRDIDIAVILKENGELESIDYLDELTHKLHRELGIPIDMVDIRYVPDWLKIRIFQGMVLVDKDPITRIRYKLLVKSCIIRELKYHDD